jgi:hypothetical protein
MQLLEKTPAPQTGGFGKFGTLDLDNWRQTVETGDDGESHSPRRSTSERIAVALERLVERLGGIETKKPAPLPPEPSINGDRVYHPSVAAKLMLLNHQTIRKHCRQGKYGFQDGSGRWWIRQSEIDHYLKGRKKIHGK